MFNQNISDCISFLRENSDVITNGVELFVPSPTGKNYELSDAEIWDLDEDTPCEWIVADETTYNKLAIHPSFIPFTDKAGKALMVVVPQEVADKLPYYTVVAYTYNIDDEDNGTDLGDFCGMADGEPRFDIEPHTDMKVRKFYTEDKAKECLAELKEYYSSRMDFNRAIFLATQFHYHEDGEWAVDSVDNNETIEYQFKDLSGAVVVRWSWVTYIGYARKFDEVYHVSEFDANHDESLLVAKDGVGRPQFSLIFTAEEVEELKNNGTYESRLREKLSADHWMWTNPEYIFAYLED